MDENVVSASNNRALFIDESKELLAQIPTIKQTAALGKLTLYERTNTEYNTFVKLTSELPSVNTYDWTDNDIAYQELGDYVAGDGITYPFRSLFTKRSVEEREFIIKENEETITLEPLLFGSFRFSTEEEKQEKKSVQKERIGEYDSAVDVKNVNHMDLASKITAAINDSIPATTLLVNKITASDDSSEKKLGMITTDPIQPAAMLVKNPDNTLYQDADRTIIESTISETAPSINVIDKQYSLVYDSATTNDLNPQAVKQCGLLINGSATAETDNDFLRFTSLNQRGCLSFGIPNLEHKNGYLVAVEYRHIEGRPLLFSIINETARHTELEVYLRTRNSELNDQQWLTDYFILPPLASDGLGYNPYISNDSIGRHRTINDLKRIRIYTFPYNELTHLHTFKGSSFQGVYSNSDISVDHPNPAFYKIQINGSLPAGSEPGMTDTLILSQSYDPGWIAYDATNKKFLSNHVLVNNWSNGWTLKQIMSDELSVMRNTDTNFQPITHNSEPVTIILFFWPQLLQFFGFFLLPIPFIIRFFSVRNI